MLRTNLATKPFYNERGIHVGLAVAAALVVGMTIFNLARIVVLNGQLSDFDSRATTAENRAHELLAHANSVRRGLNPKELEAAAGAAHEANTLIGQRMFSWTDLLNRLETTLPDDVRITSMRPLIDKDGNIMVSMTAVGRRVEDINRFMANLDGTGSFSDVFSRDETSTEDGLRQTSIEARYLPK